MTDQELCIAIARRVQKAGGRTFYVGGCVRDKYRQQENKDLDIEVHGISEDTLLEILKESGKVHSFGRSFGILAISGHNVDIGMPRKEINTGKRHRDFEVAIDPYIGYEEAARRRDFTINALMEDVLSGELIDCFHGLEDLKNGIIRCVDPATFIEDPLRVLRAAQFAARFDYTIEPSTLFLCQGIDISTLSKERVLEETRKALGKSRKPSTYFESLRKMNQLSFWYKEIEDLIGVIQDPLYHPEGDVYTHTMEVLDRAANYLDKVSDPYRFEMLALCHDFGKVITTQTIDGRIHSYGHEIKGLSLVKSFCQRFDPRKTTSSYLLNMVPLHMRPLTLAQDHSSIKACNHLFDQALAPQDLIYISCADSGLSEDDEKIIFLKERYALYEEYMARDYVTGADLLAAGIQPYKGFSLLLAYAHKLRLAGVDKETALKMTLGCYQKNIQHGNSVE